jgi:hypothetical protein
MTKPKTYGPIQLANHAGLSRWMIPEGQKAGIVPAPDVDGGWSEEAAADVAARAEEIKEHFARERAARPLGANLAADRLSERLGVDVEGVDVRDLHQAGVLAAAGEYEGWPTYAKDALDALDAAVVEQVVADRLAWRAISLDRYEAAARLGWRVAEFRDAAAKRGLQARHGRYAVADVDALADDEEITGAREVGIAQAAEDILEIRVTDLRYILKAGLLQPSRWVEFEISRRVRRDTPLFRVADVRAVLDVPGIDWDAVRAVKPGEPSPLREIARLDTARGALVRGFAADLSERWGVEITPSYDQRADEWVLSWTSEQGAFPARAVREELGQHPDLAEHRHFIVLRPEKKTTETT